MKNIDIFKNPPRSYSPTKIVHAWSENLSEDADKIIEQGYGGVVTNVPFENDFTGNDKNIDRFSDILKNLEEKKLPFWIYDEKGYPSGYAGGITLREHPELAAKGMFMYKRFAFEDIKAKYHLPDEADKIVWAAKYPYGTQKEKGMVDYSKMTPVSFSDDYIECDLRDHEVLYVFSVKTAYEGAHALHNAFAQMPNINIMDEKAVRRFIDVAYEPIVSKIPDAYERAENVFTDEPSLFTPYVISNQTYTYALAPYADGIFQSYEAEYGESILPLLPFLFEGDEKSYPTRIKFYELVGNLIAKSYSSRLDEWCKAHGCRFSGHYLGESSLFHHVLFYGNYITVLKNTGYPGIDTLDCFPEVYSVLNEKIPQMAARKMGTNGMMVELCPFYRVDEFEKDKFNNMKCITALCYLMGARKAHSYFQPKEVDEMRNFNDYIGRIGYMLDGLDSESNIFVYCPMEEYQAKTVPAHSGGWDNDKSITSTSLTEIADTLEYGSFDFYFADSDDIIAGAENGNISNMEIKTVIIPQIEVMREATLKSLKKLASNGVRIRFIGGKPTLSAEKSSVLDTSEFDTYELGDVMDELYSDGGLFVCRSERKLVKARFNDGERVFYMIVNPERTDAEIKFNHGKGGTIWLPEDGSSYSINAGDSLTVQKLRTVFVFPQ